MRKEFGKLLHEEMRSNKKVWCLAGGVGYGMLDRIIHDFPDRFVSCEASEQAMMGIAVGLARSGKIPVVFAITPHFYYALPWIRNFMDHEKVPVKMVGIGRDQEYGKLGFTHWAEDAAGLWTLFPNLHCYWPDDAKDMKRVFKGFISEDQPKFLSLRRT